MLPNIQDPDITAECLEREAEICELAGHCVEMFAGVNPEETDLLNEHLNAVVLCNELLWAHESGASPAEESLHFAAAQLKGWHLRQLDLLSYTTEDQD